jgi:hypothetical protein
VIDYYDTPSAESLLLLGRQRHSGGARARRLLITEAAAAAVYLAAASLLAALGGSPRSPSPPALAFTVVAYLIAGRVRYPVGSAWTAPTQLVFVPMLFVLPTAWVPLIVAACSVADQLPQATRAGPARTRLLARVGDSFYALGPAIVLVAFHGQTFSWQRWPLLLGALAAQVAADAGTGLARSWFAERIPAARQLPMLWLYVTDACLSCAGLVIAASAVVRPGLVLMALPLVGVLWLLGRERQERLHYSLALNQEHRIAVELQRGLLPKRLPDIPGVDLVAHYQAADRGTEAGGDWYDAFALPDGRVGVVVGDVAGHGIPAASAMGQLRSVTRAFALADDAGSTPADVLTRLNRYQRALVKPELFTVIYAIVDPKRRTMCWACAGHPPPLLRSGSGHAQFLEGGGALVGMAETVYENVEQALRPSDTLILYSDGLVERRGESVDIGLNRLAGAVARGPDEPSRLCEHVLGEMLSPTPSVHDDVTAMVVQIRGDI